MNLLMEKQTMKAAFAPVDLNTAAITGARIGLQKGDRVAIVIHMGTSIAATAEFTLRQHNAASAGTSKNLVVDNPYYHKAGVATQFTKVQPGAATAVYDVSSLFNADGGLVVFEVLSEQLDTNGGYGWISVDVTDSAAAKLGSGIYILSDMRHAPAYGAVL